MPSIRLQQWKRKSSMCSRTVKLPSRQATDSRVPHGTPITEFLPPALPLLTHTTGGITQLFSNFLHYIQISYNHIQVLKHIHAFRRQMAEYDLENWLHATSVVWELSLPGLNVWLGNTLAYIILHLQKFAASAVQTATCREESRPDRGAAWMLRCGGECGGRCSGGEGLWGGGGAWGSAVLFL